jgi:hypothetical protein
MSDVAISSLEKRVEALLTENTTLKAEARDRRIKGKKLQEQLDAATKERDGLTKERDAFQAKADAAPSELQAKIDDLAGQIRTRDHRDAFQGVNELKVKAKDDAGKDVEKTYTLHAKASIEKVWGEIGYKAEGDLPDAAAITGHLGKALEAAPYLFQEKAVDTAANGSRGPQNPITTPRGSAGPGIGTRVTNPPPSGPVRVAASDIPGRI